MKRMILTAIISLSVTFATNAVTTSKPSMATWTGFVDIPVAGCGPGVWEYTYAMDPWFNVTVVSRRFLWGCN